MLISPRSTFQNWGSSSIDSLRITRPTAVMRGSFFILKTGPLISFCARSDASRASASGYIERNFTM